MAPVAFHLLALQASSKPESFVSKLRSLPDSKQPLWVGQTHHWVHEPHLSINALLGSESQIRNWDYLIVGKRDWLSELDEHISTRWSITADAPDSIPPLAAKKKSLLDQPVPELPEGWSLDNHTGLDASTAPKDLSFSLDKTSRVFRSQNLTDRKTVKDFVRDFGTSHSSPVVMFNLLSYLPNKRPVYMEGYVAGFGKTIGPMFGGNAIQFGFGASGWTSKAEESKQEGGWEDAALVWYPSIWHFAKMIDDPEYVALDRKFKPFSIRDNALLCCTEVVL